MRRCVHTRIRRFFFQRSLQVSKGVPQHSPVQGTVGTQVGVDTAADSVERLADADFVSPAENADLPCAFRRR